MRVELQCTDVGTLRALHCASPVGAAGPAVRPMLSHQDDVVGRPGDQQRES